VGRGKPDALAGPVFESCVPNTAAMLPEASACPVTKAALSTTPPKNMLGFPGAATLTRTGMGTAALAALEVRVHLDLPFDLLPNDFVLVRATVPDELIGSIDRPSGEGTAEIPTVAAGDAWLAQGQSAAVRVPSILLSHAWNVLLNPRHPDAGRASIDGIEPFRFDPRLWQPLATEG